MPEPTDYLTRAEAAIVAEAAAQKAVDKTLLAMGLDPRDAKENQKDHAHLREWRKIMEGLRGRVYSSVATAGVLVFGAVALIVMLFGIKIPPSWIPN